MEVLTWTPTPPTPQATQPTRLRWRVRSLACLRLAVELGAQLRGVVDRGQHDGADAVQAKAQAQGLVGALTEPREAAGGGKNRRWSLDGWFGLF